MFRFSLRLCQIVVLMRLKAIRCDLKNIDGQDGTISENRDYGTRGFYGEPSS